MTHDRAPCRWRTSFIDLFGRAVQNSLQGDRAVQPGGSDMPAFGNPPALGFLPVTPVEKPSGLEARSVDIIETAGIHRDAVGLGTGDVERVHSAMRAESVLGHTGAKGIRRQ